MKKCLILLMLMASSLMWGQSTTSISLNVTDTDGQAWYSGTWKVQLVPTAGTIGGPPWYIMGTVTPLPNQSQSGSLDASGNASFTLAQNTSIAPSLSKWQLTVCPLATADCYTTRITASGASQSVNLTPPGVRVSFIQPQYKVQLYQDIEATGMTAGQTYWNLGVPEQRIYNGTSWITLGGLTGFASVSVSSNIQTTINTACASSPVPTIYIPATYTGTDTFNNTCNAVILDMRGVGTYRGGTISIKDFGANGDGGWYRGMGALPSGSGPTFGIGVLGSNPVAGMTFVIPGAGVAGADFTCTIQSYTGGAVTCAGGATTSTSLLANGNQNGFYWGWVTNDGSALTAAVNYCRAMVRGGCTIDFPAGVYFFNGWTFPALSGSLTGQIRLHGMGRESTWIVATGITAGGAALVAPAASVSTYIDSFGFDNVTGGTGAQWAIQWQGGYEHTFTNNYVGGMQGMVNAANTWINVIENNRCYTPAGSCVEFGGAAGTGPVNATWVTHNEFSTWGASGHAVYTHTNTASYGVHIVRNSVENSNTPFGTAMDLSDNLSEYGITYNEIVKQAGVYDVIIRGTYNTWKSPSFPCMQILGASNQIYSSGQGATNCIGQTYMVNVGASYNQFYGATAGNLSALGNNYLIGPDGFQLYQSVGYLSGSNPNQSVARKTEALQFYAAMGGNPTAIMGVKGYITSGNGSFPQVPLNTVMAPGDVMLDAYNGNNGSFAKGMFVCTGSNCTSADGHTWTGGSMKTIASSSCQVMDGTAAPTTGTYKVCDFVRNTNPTTGIYGWTNTIAGTPGTWRPIQSSGGYSVVTSSATPVFDASLGTSFKNTLTANVTSSTLTNALQGQTLVFNICQNATGGFTFTWPTNVYGEGTPTTTASVCSSQAFVYDGTNAYAIGPMIDQVGTANSVNYNAITNVNGGSSMSTNGTTFVDSVQNITALKYKTQAACASSASPAACSNYSAGFVTIAAGATTITVNTAAVSANSQIFVQEDDTVGTNLGVTCNTTGNRNYAITARTAATSFQITANAAPATNPACLSYFIIN